MSYNPFDFFRRNQKVVFAILTIVCMFVFILQFGQGDIFTQLAGMGPTREPGAVVTTLYGTKVHEGDLAEANARRQLATEFLFATLWEQQTLVSPPQPNQMGGFHMIPTAAEDISKLDGNLGRTAKAVLDEAIKRGSRFGQVQSPMEQRETDFAIRHDLDRLRNAMLFDRTTEGKSAYLGLEAKQRGALDNMVLFLQYELYRTAPGSNFGDLFRGLIANPGHNKTFYLGGGRTTEELLDFLLWKKQADKLGIHPSDSSVLRLSLTYTGAKAIPTSAGAADFADNEKVKKFMQARPQSERAPAKELLEALRDEVRVALARETLTGRLPAGTFPAIALSLLPTTPTQPTIAEGFEEFIRQTTTADVALLEVPVQAFLDKVTQPPTEAELQRMFDKYKKDEPNPDERRPGFKEPRRAQVQYLHLSGTSKFIQEQANRARELSEAVMPIGIAAGVQTGSPLPWLFTLEAMKPASVLAEAHAQRVNRGNTLESWLNDENMYGDKYGMHDTAWMRLQTKDSGGGLVPVLVGELLAGVGTNPSGPLSALNASAAKAWVYESSDRKYYKDRLEPAIVSGVVPQGSLYSALALAVLEHRRELPSSWPVNLATVAPLLRQEQTDRMTASIRGGLMRDAYDQVKKLRDKPGKESQQALLKFLKERGIESALHTTPYAEDMFELRADPTMIELGQICDRAMTLGQPKAPGIQLALALGLSSRGTYDPLRWGPRYDLHRLVGSRQGNPGAVEEYAGSMVLNEPDGVIVWRSEDTRESKEMARLDDEVPATLATFLKTGKTRVTVREKVIAAWQLLDAQIQAEKEAKKIRDELRALKGKESPEAILQRMREKTPGVVKEWQGVARLVRVQTATPTDPTFAPGEVPLSIIAKPRGDTIDLLMSGFNQVGDVVLIPDAPARHWYVAVCQRRTEPTPNAFLLAMKAVTMPINRMYYSAHLVPMEEREYDEALLAQLRRDACKEEERIDGSGRWRIPSFLRTNFERGSDGGDF